jgi:hypothetical protein
MKTQLQLIGHVGQDRSKNIRRRKKLATISIATNESQRKRNKVEKKPNGTA